jgi:hypothetical protein
MWYKVSFQVIRSGYGGIVYAFITPEGEGSHDITHRERWECEQYFQGIFLGFLVSCALWDCSWVGYREALCI